MMRNRKKERTREQQKTNSVVFVRIIFCNNNKKVNLCTIWSGQYTQNWSRNSEYQKRDKGFENFWQQGCQISKYSISDNKM